MHTGSDQANQANQADQTDQAGKPTERGAPAPRLTDPLPIAVSQRAAPAVRLPQPDQADQAD